MYCSNCGQKIEDHLDKKCLFSYESSLLLKSFIITTFLCLSKFNKNLIIYPIEELYNSFAFLSNLPNVEEIKKIYGCEDDWQDLIFLSISNLAEDKLFDAIIKNEFQESNYEWFIYNDDRSFYKKEVEDNLEKLTWEKFKKESGKPLWEVFSGKN